MTARAQLKQALLEVGLHEHAKNLPRAPKGYNGRHINMPAYCQLLALMIWSATPQGHAYWCYAYNKLRTA